ncbi:MAG: hypothetical protein IPP66_13590 [Anaerolineales bacterium]|nr:hypothetical protein [Anaerolineales bacterium]
MSSLIRVFEIQVPEITDVSADSNNTPLTPLASRITDNIMDALGNGNPSRDFTVNEMEINDRAQVHCEKWVEEVGYHFVRYSNSKKPDLIYPINQSGNRNVLKSKVYSGDVSGTIGESLFSLYIIKCFFLSDGDFAHLRTDNSSVYPDFAIYTPSQEMLSNFGWPEVSEIPAEVKNANELERSAIYPQIRKSIQQIRSFWRRRGATAGPSMIGVTVRNQRQQTYDLAVIWR